MARVVLQAPASLSSSQPPPRGSQAGLAVARPPSAMCFIQVASGAENT